MLVRWPGVIKPGTLINEIFSQEDWLPTLVAAAGEPNVVDKLKEGYKANGKTFKVHADGYNFVPYFKGEVKKGPREQILYFGAGGDLNAVRWNDWKVNFAVVNGNIATGIREVPGWPMIVHRLSATQSEAQSMRLLKNCALNAEPVSLRALNTLKSWNNTKVVKAIVSARSCGPLNKAW